MRSRGGMALARWLSWLTVRGSIFLARLVRILVRRGRTTGLVSITSSSTAPAMMLWRSWNALERARGLEASRPFHHARTIALVTSLTKTAPSGGLMWSFSNES